MSIYYQSDEYLNGFRRYLKNIGKGRPQKSDQVFMLDEPTALNEMPKVGQQILIHETVWTEASHGCVLYDCYETDIFGEPVVYTVKNVTKDKLYLERKIKTYNKTMPMEKIIPAVWITSGHMGWVTLAEYRLQEGREGE